ncbi:MAG: alpha/beta fold hydrolase [Pseudomonadota bacterium]|nr:alpha/beta fold hydrolase [Pseudomonadota bacterium]
MRLELRRLAAVVGLAVLMAYVATGAALCTFQRALLYRPPCTPGGPAAAVFTLARPDAQLRISGRMRPGARAAIYFGGNAEDVSMVLPLLAKALPQRALYLLNYRGYCGSSGSPSQDGFYADALALFDRVQSRQPDIMVIGRSLGTGVAVFLASQRPVSHLVLITPYASIEQLVTQRFPMYPVHWLLRDKFEAQRFAPLVRTPTPGPEDPVSCGTRTFGLALSVDAVGRAPTQSR